MYQTHFSFMFVLLAAGAGVEGGAIVFLSKTNHTPRARYLYMEKHCYPALPAVSCPGTSDVVSFVDSTLGNALTRPWELRMIITPF